MGNVWINDLHHKEKTEKEQQNLNKLGSFGQNGKTSTNFDEINLDEYEEILNGNLSPETKFTKKKTGQDKASESDSLL